MPAKENQNKLIKRIQELELEISTYKLDMEALKTQLKAESERHKFYQLIADFTYGWEL